MVPTRSTLAWSVGLALFTATTVASAQRAQRGEVPPVSPAQQLQPASLGATADPAAGEDVQPVARKSRLYPIMQVVGGSIFALSYGSALIGAMLLPGPDVEPEQEKTASYLLIPIVGPFIAGAQPNAPLQVFIPMGIVQTGAAAVLTWGIIGGALDDEPAASDTAITVVPLSSDGTMPGIGVSGHF